MIKESRPKICDYNSKEFKCLLEDAHLIYNLLDQKVRAGFRNDDFIQPGLLAGQSLESVVRETIKSMLNHLDNFQKKGVLL